MDLYSLLKVLAVQLLMPLPLCIIMFLLGIFLRFRWQKVGSVVSILAIFLLTLLSWGPFADKLLEPFESQYSALYEWPANQNVSAVMVLGGGYQPNQPWVVTGQLSDSSSNRLLEGLRLWHLNPSALLIVSGADRREGVEPMARAYGKIAKNMSVPADRLVILDTPTDTGEEAKAARNVLGDGQALLLVTSASHMPRAMRHFKNAGLNPIASPTHYLALRDNSDTLSYWIPSSRHLRKSERAFYEMLGMLAVKWES